MKAVGIKRLAAGIGVIALGAGALVASGAAAEDPPAASPAANAAEEPPADSRAELARAFSEVDPLAGAAAGRLIADARRELGSSFGGAWIDRSAETPRLVVSTTGEPAAARRSLRATGAGQVEVVSARLAEPELERARRAAIEALAHGGAGFRIDADPAAGALIVGGELDRASRRSVERAAGAVPVRFERGPASFRRDALCPACYPPFRGGLLLRIGPAACTSGLTMKRRKGGRTRYVGITAGHCRTNRRSRVFIGGRKVGTVNANAFRCCRRVRADALRFPIPRKKADPSVYLTAFGAAAPVRGKLGNRILVPGTSLCFVGINSGGNCGVVTRTDLAIRSGRKIQLGLWCISVPAIPGDSGGSVIQPQAAGAVRAAGIVSGTLTTETREEMCFSPVQTISKRLGVRLVSQRLP